MADCSQFFSDQFGNVTAFKILGQYQVVKENFKKHAIAESSLQRGQDFHRVVEKHLMVSYSLALSPSLFHLSESTANINVH